MNFDNVVQHLKQESVNFTVLEHAPNLTMDDVATSEQFDMNRSWKAMAFESKEVPIVAVLLGLHRLNYGNLAKAADVSRSSLKPMTPERVQQRLGDIPGGVTPVQDDDVVVIFDETILQAEKVFCGAGRPDRTLEIAAADLLKITNSRLASIIQAQLPTT